MQDDLVGAIEIGGTHVTAARVDVAERRVQAGSLRRRELPSNGAREVLLAIMRDTVLSAARADVRQWGVAVPGPFDYERGICTIEGVGKLEALHGVDMRTAFASSLQVAPEAIRFVNDADAFLLGESWAGAARGHDAAIGITLGTGLGSAFMRDGTIVQEGTPEELYQSPASRWAAEFVGAANFVPGTVSNGFVCTSIGSFPANGAAGASAVDVLVRPELLELALDPAGVAEVVAREFRGHDVFYRVLLDGVELVSQRPSNEVVPLGSRVSIRVHDGRVPVFH